MLPILMAAALTAGLGDRSPELVGPDGKDAYSAWLASRAIEAEAGFSHQPCADAKAESVMAIPFTLDRVRVPDHPGPVVREAVRVTGCGRTSLQNIIVFRQAAGGWLGRPMFPGLSMAGLILQRDATTAALQAAFVGPPPLTCSVEDYKASLRISDVTLAAFVDVKQPWKERWPLWACGQDRPVIVSFTPTADGGADFGAAPAW
jgi:hypothetical protein